MEIKLVDNKGRCSRCFYCEIKVHKHGMFPLWEIEDFSELKMWRWCRKYRRFCKGFSPHCHAPAEGWHPASEEKNIAE